MKTYEDIGIQSPHLLLPRQGTDLAKWAVIACDQFTSEPEYWKEVEQIVGDAPSTLHMIFPEVFLEQPGEQERIRRIQSTMGRYLEDGTLQPHDGPVYVERSVAGHRRPGIMLALDLERYDFTKGSSSLVRATEGTIVERLPPRIKVRSGAPLESPHILVLIDDPGRTVIEPLAESRGELRRLYDFDLMLDSGHLEGYAVDERREQQVVAALRRLAEPEAFAARYGVGKDEPVLLFAVGDGNHSLATAKATWESIKPRVGMNHPARHALVEIENVHNTGLEFEPIHRVLFGLRKDLFAALESAFGANLRYQAVADAGAMGHAVDSAATGRHLVGVVAGGRERACGVIEIANPSAHLAVGTLQAFLDRFLAEGGAERIDYVHGEDVLVRTGGQPGNAGFYLPVLDKSDLFRTVILDGALPRKSFSIGEARQKRFYMEARRIA